MQHTAGPYGQPVQASPDPLGETGRHPPTERTCRRPALVPLDPKDRGDGRRTYVHVEGMSEPIVASRSERAIHADVEEALNESAGISRRAKA